MPTSSETTVDNTVYCRDEKLWFDDGNVILHAHGHEFRVHRSILSRHSSVLRDMLAGSRLEGEPKMESCPVVTLSDEASDLRYLLTMVYDRQFYDEAWIQCVFSDEQIDIATGVVYLAHKYGMDRFYSEAVSSLQSLFPVGRHLERWWSPPVNLVKARNGGPARLMRLINVARSIETPELTAMLPLLLYLGAQLTLDELLDGSPRKDGTIERLQPHDFRICIAGRASLVTANSSATRCFRPSAKSLSPACKTQPACYKALAAMVSDALKETFFAHSDPLRDVTDWFKAGNSRWRLCCPCVEHVLNSHMEAREKIWGDLATILHLDKEVVVVSSMEQSTSLY